MEGMAFGSVAQHLFGHVVSTPAIFAVVAMGGVFGAAAQAPLTAIASVVEMTGNFTLMLPVMLVVGIATAVSKHLSYGSIYTTKLLRRGIDIERPLPTNVLHTLTVADVMQPVGMGAAALELGASPVEPLSHRPRWLGRLVRTTRPTWGHHRSSSATRPSTRHCASWSSTAGSVSPFFRPMRSIYEAGSPAATCCTP